MGLLVLGTPLQWSEAKEHADYVREHGIQQFLHVYHKLKDRTGDVLLWGDEIEYMVVSFDDEKKNATLSLRQTEILEALEHDRLEKAKEANGDGPIPPVFHPEYGRYMLESTPGAPYGASLKDLLTVEDNMKLRRRMAKARMKENELPLTLTSFPRLGAPGQFTDPYCKPGGGVARSFFLPDEITNPHVRFPTLTANIRRRRGSKVAINMPIYHDKNTPRPFIDPTIPFDRDEWPEDANARDGAALSDHIYMDAMGFGMGCCCLQLTFQACSISEARRMYDALVPVGPIMLALTAAAPIFRGYLADVDCRWDVIAGSVDDRTPEERGKAPLQHDRFRIPKSRYDSVDCYIYDDPSNRPEYNDNDMPFDATIKEKMIKDGVDPLLATHFAHLFIRDPIVIFKEAIVQDDQTSTDHFENIQSTNWQTVRFKPPPPGSEIGWRVEFRSMEVQLTDYENAAHAIFIVLLTRAIMSLGLNFYIPISKVDENMHRAHRRDAVHSQKFFFRKDFYSPKPGHGCAALDAEDAPRHGRPTQAQAQAQKSPDVQAFVDAPAATNGLPPHITHINASINGHAGSSSHKRETSTCSCCPSHSNSRAQSPVRDFEFGPVQDEYDEFTIDEIINGDASRSFPGLMGVVEEYLDSLEIDKDTRAALEKSLQLVRRRANGSLVTTATWMRNFVTGHPSYKQDSVVSQEICYDLCKAVDELERCVRKASDLLPDCYKGCGKVERKE